MIDPQAIEGNSCETMGGGEEDGWLDEAEARAKVFTSSCFDAIEEQPCSGERSPEGLSIHVLRPLTFAMSGRERRRAAPLAIGRLRARVRQFVVHSGFEDSLKGAQVLREAGPTAGDVR